MKTCPCCETAKPITEFHRAAWTPDGRQHECRECVAARVKVLRVKNARACAPKPPKHINPAMRLQKFARVGVTEEWYDATLESQGGCAICGRTEPGGQGRFHIDHDHACCPGRRSCGRCLRGILCVHCNTMLGFARDSTETLGKAISYLESHSG